MFVRQFYTGGGMKKKMLFYQHLRVHMNSFKRFRAFQIELEFGSVGF